MGFDGANVLITGGSSGIGKATAMLLAGAGANVAILARDTGRLAAALDEIRSRAADPTAQSFSGFSADVSQADQVEDAVRQLVEAGSTPDYLFNIAGFAHPGYFHQLPLDVFRETMAVNFFGTLHTTRVVAPLMMARRQGHIINTSSVAGFLGVFGYSAYSASKFAIRGFTDVIRSELKPYGVHVSILFPPDTDTPQLWYENEFKPAETRAISGNVKTVTPESVASQLLRAVERKRYIILPGVESKLVYGAAGLLGAKIHRVFDAIVRKAQETNGGPPPVELPDWYRG